MLVNQKELAKEMRVSATTIRRWEEEGVIERVKGYPCRYDLETVRRKVRLANGDYSSELALREAEKRNIELLAENRLLKEAIKRAKETLETAEDTELCRF